MNNSVTGYRVCLDAFEGPLDLLLYLVKHDEVDIYDISLERLTRQYLEFLDKARLLDVPMAGEFLVMAAHLMYLKSQELLPRQIQPPGEDAEDDDPRWDLIRQLLEYKKFKDAAAHLGRSEADRALRYAPRSALCASFPPDEPPPDLDLAGLLDAFRRVLARAVAAATVEPILDDRWTVPAKIALLRRAVRPGKTVRFSALFQAGAPRGEMIAVFLAILELIKNCEFRASQNHFLGDIELQRVRKSKR